MGSRIKSSAGCSSVRGRPQTRAPRCGFWPAWQLVFRAWRSSRRAAGVSKCGQIADSYRFPRGRTMIRIRARSSDWLQIEVEAE